MTIQCIHTGQSLQLMVWDYQRQFRYIIYSTSFSALINTMCIGIGYCGYSDSGVFLLLCNAFSWYPICKKYETITIPSGCILNSIWISDFKTEKKKKYFVLFTFCSSINPEPRCQPPVPRLLHISVIYEIVYLSIDDRFIGGGAVSSGK